VFLAFLDRRLATPISRICVLQKVRLPLRVLQNKTPIDVRIRVFVVLNRLSSAPGLLNDQCKRDFESVDHYGYGPYLETELIPTLQNCNTLNILIVIECCYYTKHESLTYRG
jgi:hypothetical protein